MAATLWLSTLGYIFEEQLARTISPVIIHRLIQVNQRAPDECPNPACGVGGYAGWRDPPHSFCGTIDRQVEL
jgi:hypothetical protein